MNYLAVLLLIMDPDIMTMHHITGTLQTQTVLSMSVIQMESLLIFLPIGINFLNRQMNQFLRLLIHLPHQQPAF